MEGPFESLFGAWKAVSGKISKSDFLSFDRLTARSQIEFEEFWAYNSAFTGQPAPQFLKSDFLSVQVAATIQAEPREDLDMTRKYRRIHALLLLGLLSLSPLAGGCAVKQYRTQPDLATPHSDYDTARIYFAIESSFGTWVASTYGLRSPYLISVDDDLVARVRAEHFICWEEIVDAPDRTIQLKVQWQSLLFFKGTPWRYDLRLEPGGEHRVFLDFGGLRQPIYRELTPDEWSAACGSYPAAKVGER